MDTIELAISAEAGTSPAVAADRARSTTRKQA